MDSAGSRGSGCRIRASSTSCWTRRSTVTSSTTEHEARAPSLDECAYQLALDQVWAERARRGARVWHPRTQAVVLGVSSRVDAEIDRAACEADDVAVLRRGSGGATVLLAPDVVCFSASMPHDAFAPSSTIGGAYRHVVGALAAGFESLGIRTGFERPCDVTVGRLKLVGMAQSRKRAASLVHGVVPVGLQIEQVERYLRHPPEEPAYRARRSHREFMTTLGRERPGCTPRDVAAALLCAFVREGLDPLDEDDEDRAAARELAAARYANPEWTYRR